MYIVHDHAKRILMVPPFIMLIITSNYSCLFPFSTAIPTLPFNFKELHVFFMLVFFFFRK